MDFQALLVLEPAVGRPDFDAQLVRWVEYVRDGGWGHWAMGSSVEDLADDFYNYAEEAGIDPDPIPYPYTFVFCQAWRRIMDRCAE